MGTRSLYLPDVIYYFVYSSLPAMLKFQNYVWHGEMEQMRTRLHIRYPRCENNSISCRYPTLALEVRSRNTEDEIRVRSHLVPGHNSLSSWARYKIVLCPNSGYPSCLSSTLLRQQMPFLQKERRSWLWVKVLGTNKKHVHTVIRCPQVSTLYSGTGTVPEF